MGFREFRCEVNVVCEFAVNFARQQPAANDQIVRYGILRRFAVHQAKAMPN
jgi:hypothetical protein